MAYLDERTLLLSQRVSSAFKESIEKCPDLQLNPLVAQLQDHWPGDDGNKGVGSAISVDFLPSFMERAGHHQPFYRVKHPEGSWRRMQLLSPDYKGSMLLTASYELDGYTEEEHLDFLDHLEPDMSLGSLMDRAEITTGLQKAGRYAFLRTWRVKVTRGEMRLNNLISFKAMVRHLSLAYSLPGLDHDTVIIADQEVRRFAYGMRSQTAGALECDDKESVTDYFTDDEDADGD